MRIALDAITIGPGHRKTTKAAVKELADSIGTIGLHTPITVRPAKERGRFILVAGRHRMDAHRVLGRDSIEAVVLADELEAELWELSENYHRADLTAMQRNVALGQWVKLKARKIKREQGIRAGQVGQPRGGKQPNDAGVAAATRELGVPRTTARRAVNIASHLTKKAQREAEKLGLDNNQRALERAAGVPGEEEQIASLHRTVKAQQERNAVKARIQENLSGNAPPKSGKEAFERWYWSLDAQVQSMVRIWLLEFEPAAFIGELERTHEEVRASAMTLH